MACHGHWDVLDKTSSEYALAIKFSIIGAAWYIDKHCAYYIIGGCWRWGGQASSSSIISASLWFAWWTAGTGAASLWFVPYFAVGPPLSSLGNHKAPESDFCCSVQGDHGQTIVVEGTDVFDSGAYGLCTAYVNRGCQ